MPRKAMLSIMIFTSLLLCSLRGSDSGEEQLLNRDFSQTTGKIPAHWQYQQNKTGPEYKLMPGEDGAPAAVRLIGRDRKTLALLMQVKRQPWPAGTLAVISGEYRTGELEYDASGRIYTSLMCRTGWGRNAPQFWLTGDLSPSSQWKSFRFSKRLSYSVISTSLYAVLMNVKGHVDYRNLSLKMLPPAGTADPSESYVWKEAEDIDRITPPSNWGHDLAPDYYSGKGGIFLKQKNFNWNFQIAPVTDPVTLFSKPRTWYVWARVYGYMNAPRIYLYRNEKYMSHIDTPPNEKVDRQGNYAGPGAYTWVLCGQFTTEGGAQQLSFRPKERMLLDAMLLTTDARYQPRQFEARSFPQAKVIDVITAHAIQAEYAQEGVCDTIALPLSFRIGGKRLNIPGDQPPAIFHFSLPENIRIKGLTSHRAGSDWNNPADWGTKFLTWKRTGVRTLQGKKICDYEAYLYCLCGNQYLIFLQADSAGFVPGQQSLCTYYLEHGKEKQLPETIALKHFSIPATTPFKNIYIGGNYVPFNMMYLSWPDVFKNLGACGFNYIGAWHSPKADSRFENFRRQAHARNFMISIVVDLFANGIRKDEAAVGLDGKPITKAGGSGVGIATLSLDENSWSIRRNMERTRQCAANGISVIYDDEMFNVVGDTVDYHPKTKTLFRTWLAERGLPYSPPEEIVRNKKNNPEMYRRWVDFKCSRVALWYSLYRKAFDEGVAQARAAGKYSPHMKPGLFTCVQSSDVSPQALKESNSLDYRLLGKYCDGIFMMSYTYEGVRGSSRIGNKLEMYNRYMGDNRTAVILLAGGYGTEITAENKVMLKYQLWEALMQKSRYIEFYAGATLFNVPTLAPVVDAIRTARPYEDFFVKGTVYKDMKGSEEYLRLKALRLDSRILLYAANYYNDDQKTVSVDFPAQLKKVTDCSTGKILSTGARSFSIDFRQSRGRLLLIEL